MFIKILLLREYHIEFFGFTIVLIGALVVAKVVLALEYVKIPFTKNQPAWMEILVRMLLYIFGIFVVMFFKKSFEARHEYEGMLSAFKHITKQADIYHIWVNIICVSGALFFFNLLTVLKKHYGAGILMKIMTSPLPENEKTK